MPIKSLKPSFKFTKNTKGFSLLEIVISLFLIISLILILLVTTGTFNSTRNSNLNSLAAKIASRRIETLRKTDYSQVTIGGPTSFSDSDLAKLPNSTATQTVSYLSGTTSVKLVTTNIDWTVNNGARNIKMETLLYEYGI